MKSANKTGTCAICGATQKLVVNRDGVEVLARHGFRIHGLGISGRACWGAGYEPQEVSLRAVEEFRDHQRVMLGHDEKRLAELEAETPQNPLALRSFRSSVENRRKSIKWADDKLTSPFAEKLYSKLFGGNNV